MATLGPNENIEYEKFVQEIYQTILDSEDIKPTTVQHNIELMGRSGCLHQIDVYWEYIVGGIKQRVAIECKNFNTSNVPIGRIRDFYGALTDIGNVNGIFVCKNGYQSGAIKFADFYGINLKEIRVPKDEDWTGRLKTIKIDISIIKKDVKERRFDLDLDWFRMNYPDKSINDNHQISGTNNQIFIEDDAGNILTNLLDQEDKLPHDSQTESDREYTFTYEDCYININGIGKAKIASMYYLYDVKKSEPHSMIISGKDMAKAILKDVKTGTITFFNKDGSIK